MAKALHALGLFCARHWLWGLALWVLLIAGVYGAVGVFGSQTNNDLELPGTDSQHARDLLADRFNPQQNGANPIVFHVDKGKLTDDAYKQAVKDSVKALGKAPHVYSVTNPLSSSGKTAGLLSKDKQTAFAPVLMDIDSGALDEEAAQKVFDATKPAQDAGITVAAAGSIGTELSDQPTESSELVGILAAMLILTLVLGSLVAMGLPILTAVFGLATALGVIGLLGHLLSIPTTGPTLATMIGLGVGIDYALFLITRHQEQLKAGVEMDESIARTVSISGGAVVFAGATVIVALVALRVAGIPLLSTLGIASAIAVLTSVLSAITLLPSIMGMLKHRIHWASLPAFMRKEKSGGGAWASWAGVVAKRPMWFTVGSLALLVPLIIPALSLEFGQDDIGATPTSTTERQAFDLITAGFGIGYNGPLQVASKFDPVVSPSEEYTDDYNEAMKLKKQLDKLSKELPKQQKQLEAQQADLEAQQTQLEKQQAQLEKQSAALQQQASNLEAQKAELERQKAELEKKQAPLLKKKQALQAKQAKLQREKNALEAEARAIAKQMERLGAALAANLRRQQHIREEIANTTDPDRLARLEARLERLQARETEIRNQLAKDRDRLERLAERGKELARQAAVLAEQAAKLEKQAAALQKQADQLQAQAAKLQREGDQLTAKKAQLEREGAALQKSANALKKQANQLQQQANELKKKQQQAEKKQKKAEKLQDELTDMVTAAGGDARATDPRVVKIQNALSATSGVVALTPPQTNKKGDVVLLSAIPKYSPASNATSDLLAKVRADVIPKATAEGGVTSYVGGYTASYADLASLIAKRLLLVIGTVVLLGFLLLMIAFRSILVPLQAAITNVLSAAAAFGILTATFQWGWGIDLVGIDTARDTVPIASYVPLMMFAVLFGLSMDYEVFLVSHIQQHHFSGEPARQATRSGLASSGRITTAACLIMTAVFASFILNGDPTIKQFGVGLASAVLLAGILVVTLAPAMIALMGETAWWLPRWLDKILPHIDLEGGPQEPAPEPATPAAGPPGPAAAPEPAPPEPAAAPTASTGAHAAPIEMLESAEPVEATLDPPATPPQSPSSP